MERKTEYAALSGFFNFCKEFNYCLSSPLEKVRTPHKSTKDPKHIHPDKQEGSWRLPKSTKR